MCVYFIDMPKYIREASAFTSSSSYGGSYKKGHKSNKKTFDPRFCSALTSSQVPDPLSFWRDYARDEDPGQHLSGNLQLCVHSPLQQYVPAQYAQTS